MAQKTLVIVFDDESRAYGALHALERLEERDDLSLHDLAIIVKNPDGSTRTAEIGSSWSLARATAGSLVGGLFGVSGGPVGVAVGLIGGAVIGSIIHKKGSVDDELDKDISDALPAGKSAVIGEVLEETEHSVDTRMAALDGIVFRWTSDQSKRPRITRTRERRSVSRAVGSFWDQAWADAQLWGRCRAIASIPAAPIIGRFVCLWAS